MEAKRHQPSVVYIPSLVGWCAAVSETARTTVRAMLDTLAPTDPVLLLAVVDGSFSQLPRDVRQWFGATRENRVALVAPTPSQRETFFEGLFQDVRRPPNHFPDGIKRKKRVLEILPIAPPLEPRQPTAAELAMQEVNDQRVITLLKYRLGPIISELRRKFKRFTKSAAVRVCILADSRDADYVSGRRSTIMTSMPLLPRRYKWLQLQSRFAPNLMASLKLSMKFKWKA